MYTAYRCFDGDDDECISEEEVRLLLATVPLNCDTHEPGVIPDANINKQVYERKRRDEAQIESMVETLFEDFPEGLYFDEFCALTERVTSELFAAVYDCIYQCVPCVKTFLTMRANYKQFVN
jgi:hypothetical protein